MFKPICQKNVNTFLLFDPNLPLSDFPLHGFTQRKESTESDPHDRRAVRDNCEIDLTRGEDTRRPGKKETV